MAKKIYKIPYGLNTSYGDVVIALRDSSGLGLKPMPIKVILAWLVSFFFGYLLLVNSIVQYGTMGQKALFVIFWCAMTWILLKRDGTNRMRIEAVMVLFDYLPKSRRRVLTRSSGDATGFYSIAGIRGITKNGLIEFSDGTYGYMYRVVGSASVLLFDSDKQNILDRVDSFYRKMNTDAECLFITTKASQTVYKQILALKRRYDNLSIRDPELLDLAEDQFKVLKNYVGEGFKSIHQYMLIKADSKEMLSQTKNVLQSEVENSSMMIKRCIPMYYDDVIIAMELIFKGKGR